MKNISSQSSIPEMILAAFPRAFRSMANEVSRELVPVVDDHYRFRSKEADVMGTIVRIPERLLITGVTNGEFSDRVSIGANCLLTRSTDGYLRQHAVRKILAVHEPWAIPFVVLLIGEYVVEIVEDIRAALSTLDQTAYAEFIKENRPLMRTIMAKSTSYWNCYYRHEYPERSSYPGWAILRELNSWAA